MSISASVCVCGLQRGPIFECVCVLQFVGAGPRTVGPRRACVALI